MRFQYLLRLLSIVSLSSGLLSCAIINPGAVSDEERDTSGAFDGVWVLQEQPLAARQTVARQNFKCKFTEHRSMLYVSGGVGRISRSGYKGSGNIGKDGRFRITIATDRVFKKTTGFVSSGAQISYIYQGKLQTQESTGLFTIGKKALNNSGCSTRIRIKNLSVNTHSPQARESATLKVGGRWAFSAHDIPDTSRPSSLDVSLFLHKQGAELIGELEFSLMTSPACGPLKSTTRTKVSAKLINDSKLILTTLENTVADRVQCGTHHVNARTFRKHEKTLLEYSQQDDVPTLTFKTPCGWRVDKRCVFNMPPLIKTSD